MSDAHVAHQKELARVDVLVADLRRELADSTRSESTLRAALRMFGSDFRGSMCFCEGRPSTTDAEGRVVHNDRCVRAKAALAGELA